MHSEELHGLYTSSNTIPVTKSRMMRNETVVTHMAEKKNARRVFGPGNSSKKGRLEDLGDHGGILT